jgi:EAL domain-containing protein (putative c-di-GMP-specific phosphodiesterase class I)/GGDEF domain-containing protein
MQDVQPGSTLDVEGLWDWNLVTGRAHFSPRWFALLGHDGEAGGTSPDEWLQRVHPDDADLVRNEIAAVRAPGRDRIEFTHRLRHRDGTYRWMCCRATVFRNERGEATRLTGSHLDITVGIVMDPVTRLPNRQRLLDHVAQAIDHARRQPSFQYAVMVLELGRGAGEDEAGEERDEVALLQAAARRLETCLRLAVPLLRGPQRDLLARLDGDRFAVLIEGLKDVSGAKRVADRALAALLEPFDMRGSQLFLAPSAGLAVSVSGYTRGEDVLRDAEAALHRARVLGGSHCEVFDAALLEAEVAQSRLERELAAALERSEFRLFYQPILSMDAQRILGLEALVRWQHPARGLIGPAEFVPQAEKSGAIRAIGQWVLREACRQLREWHRQVPGAGDLWVSVNLSAVQLRHPDLVEEISAVLQESAIDPCRLVLELTEGLAVENPDAVKTVLMRLRGMGIRISIDDFGTGYSSLGYLRQLPIDTLKIDRCFVHGMESNAETAALVETLLTMARQLDLSVVAEGVENTGQLALLRTLECGSVLGFLFARPLDAAAATGLLTNGLAFAEGAEPAGETVAGDEAPDRRGQPGNPWRLAAGATLLAGLCLAAAVTFSTGPAAATTADPGSAEQPPSNTPVPHPDVALPARVQSPASGLASGHEGPPTAPSALAPAGASLEVAHIHRLGSCRGRLIVSSDGLRYVPDDRSGKDGFVLRFGSFTHDVRGTGLTVRSKDRTYRFEATASGRSFAVRSFGDTLVRFTGQAE